MAAFLYLIHRKLFAYHVKHKVHLYITSSRYVQNMTIDHSFKGGGVTIVWQYDNMGKKCKYTKTILQFDLKWSLAYIYESFEQTKKKFGNFTGIKDENTHCIFSFIKLNKKYMHIVCQYLQNKIYIYCLHKSRIHIIKIFN